MYSRIIEISRVLHPAVSLYAVEALEANGEWFVHYRTNHLWNAVAFKAYLRDA